MFLPLITLTLPILTLAAPLSRRLDTSSYCGHWDTIPAGSYTVLLDQWGTKGATGQSCAQLTSLSGSNLAWVTDWTWSGGNGIKSYTNVQLDKGVNQQLSAIKSMPVRSCSILLSGHRIFNLCSRHGRGNRPPPERLSQTSRTTCSPQLRSGAPTRTKS